ncbi:ovostatin homolog 2-like [Balaenoptera acutorostrata]|uniref:Ovostatin homolog 2-like n=1 Tax=Balaenoptera acutorostrata TaxID=9767 RepID=A0ABM3UGR5_BALAC|nr:ovostatin homolog 2-like [Balaenoptera acutorostrata]
MTKTLTFSSEESSEIFQVNGDNHLLVQCSDLHFSRPQLVLVVVKMLSGFTPVMSFIEELESNGQVTKSEFKNDHVLFYLENVCGTAKSFTFSVEQSNHVSNIKPAPVMVYDYYEKVSSGQTGFHYLLC